MKSILDLGKYYLKNNFLTIITTIFLVIYFNASKGLGETSLLFPNLIMVLMVIVLLWDYISSFLKWRAAAKGLNNEADNNAINFKEIFCSKPSICFIITAIYVFLIYMMGFHISSVLYLIVLSYYLGIKKLTSNLIFVVLTYAGIYGVFIAWLGVSFPSGRFF